MMRSVLSLFLFFAVLVTISCSESRSVAVSSPNSDVEISTDGEVYPIVELDLDSSEVRVWLCPQGNFVFDNEGCKTRVESRKTIQDAIQERYPLYKITRILRGKDFYVVYYVSLKKN